MPQIMKLEILNPGIPESPFESPIHPVNGSFTV